MPDTATLEREASELRETIKALRASADEKTVTADKVRDEEKAKGFKLTDTSAEAKETFGRIDAAYKEASKDRSDAADLEARLHTLLDAAGVSAIDRAQGDPRHPALARAMSIGARVTNSASYKQLIESGILGLDGADPGQKFSPIEVLTRRQTANLLGGGAGLLYNDVGDGNPLVPDDQQLGDPVMIPKRVPTLLDMINVGTTGRDSVTWSRQTTRTNNAGLKAFGSALDKSRYQFETVPAPVLRKGHYAVVDEGNVADADEYEDIVNGELLSDLRLKVEYDAMHANGGSDWTGVYNASGIGSIDASLEENLPDALHRAITVVRVQLEEEPTGWGIDPVKFETFYLAKADDGHYLHHRGPLEGSPKQIWGIPAVVSTLFTKPVVAQWKKAAKLWVRQGVTISMSNNVDDFFLEGLFAIKAQVRAAYAVRQPKAICEVENFEEAEESS